MSVKRKKAEDIVAKLRQVGNCSRSWQKCVALSSWILVKVSMPQHPCYRLSKAEKDALLSDQAALIDALAARIMRLDTRINRFC
jgi:hypothetical protein